MDVTFSPDEILRSSLSPYNAYCVGYPGSGNYITTLVMGIGVTKKEFSHPGSNILDTIIAYDRAEISDAYIGQINMIMVSSFCGPQGLVWGYDIAREESVNISSLISPEKIREFEGVKIQSGENLRMAARCLFGTVGKKHFPLLPGCHVPCAGRFYTKTGPAFLYAAIAIGIPHNRNEAACLFMEDTGEIIDKINNIEVIKEKIILNSVRSVLQIGKDQGIAYKEIIVDFISKEIRDDEIGCTLIAIPYFLLAKKAFTNDLTYQTLREWQDQLKLNYPFILI